ncbi:hypothetical protein [Mucilaginibacter paludis]|uniref:Uncharacterized protein n=1 Tax=Mucilaginibacter paludis DSM 18603 TaxID=714943 RepID=H1Y2J7_9SPHI|nr:hypothetical protein [Mucilaginibacter paludis]EHQ28045.1 hypothetical protein Mucpa_3954 [Mucilaginibacter paludis DSM 18603]
MKYFKVIVILIILSTSVCAISPVMAQCAVCSTNVETNAKNGGTQANGLNNGIMYLLAAPYLAIAAVGFLWYKKYRRKNVSIKMRGEKLHLN